MIPLAEIEVPVRVSPGDIEIIAADKSPYGAAERETFDVILKLARMEGLIADPVYEGKAVRGLLTLADDGRFESGSRILLMHLGGHTRCARICQSIRCREIVTMPGVSATADVPRRCILFCR